MANPVTLPELETALDALILEDIPPELDPDDITVSRLVERAKCGTLKANRTLAKWVKAGKVEYIGVRRGPAGHNVKAWRMVKP